MNCFFQVFLYSFIQTKNNQLHMKDVFIVAAHRTPQGSFGGVLASQSAVELGTQIVKATVEKSGVPVEAIDEIFMGQVVQANAGQAPARQVAIQAGLGQHVPATTVNKVCASGLKAAMFGAQSIQLDQNQVVVAGGMESMTNVPHYLPKARYGYGYGNGVLVDGLQRDGLIDVYQTQPMGCFADATAEKYHITREEQDAFAIQSYQRAADAWSNGSFEAEVIPVQWTNKKGSLETVTEDEEYKRVNFEKIPQLKPVFTKNGTVTAANASTINDGAAALVLASQEAIDTYQLTPLAKIISYADAAQEPEWFTTAPILAAEKALKRAGLSIEQMDFFEVNEAFAVVPMAFAKHFSIPHEKLNIQGGGVAIGHPLGASGARILTTLTHILHRKQAKYGMVAICNGGGGASALIIERI